MDSDQRFQPLADHAHRLLDRFDLFGQLGGGHIVGVNVGDDVAPVQLSFHLNGFDGCGLSAAGGFMYRHNGFRSSSVVGFVAQRKIVQRAGYRHWAAHRVGDFDGFVGRDVHHRISDFARVLAQGLQPSQKRVERQVGFLGLAAGLHRPFSASRSDCSESKSATRFVFASRMYNCAVLFDSSKFSSSHAPMCHEHT
ncbi:MAG: hypothetical protein VYA67_11610 [Actinomycetota bacterium]|uniref:Uncharacterized protein n=1 Tax=Mycobacterium lentiflavum TaxID=141349 RepID=A0ABY3UNU6_MYCLN|nr:hypothetical protein [Mycobacterium lentiflavum]MEE3064590.1 hypothetical protein [Actinomycetota bacterium]ULP40268.1 hypothetical protein MJO58_14645 [Mycobacterium lentiflavum]